MGRTKQIHQTRRCSRCFKSSATGAGLVIGVVDTIMSLFTLMQLCKAWMAAMGRILAFASIALVLAGCASSSLLSKQESAEYSRHPVLEKRMSNRAEDGYLPSGVWRIRGKSNTVYLVGAIHILGEKDVPFPSPFYAAYNDSSQVFTETIMAPLTLCGMIRLRFTIKSSIEKWWNSHLEEMMCPDGRRLGDYVAPETMERLRAYFATNFANIKGAGPISSGIDKLSPLGCMFFAELLDFLKPTSGSERNVPGVDETFEYLARKVGKPLHALDDKKVLNSVLKFLDDGLAQTRMDIALRGADAVIREDMLDDPVEDDAEMITSWRRGDLEALDRSNMEIQQKDPVLYKQLLTERNQKWMLKLLPVIRGKKNAMVVVGAAHLCGKDGLLQLLHEAGYPAEQMYGVDRPVPVEDSISTPTQPHRK